MKILQLVTSVGPGAGGVGEGVLNQSAALAALGHTVEIASLDAEIPHTEGSYPVPIHAVGHIRYRSLSKIGLIRRYGFSLNFITWLWMSVNRYDVIIVNGLWNFLTMAALVVTRLRRPVPYFIFVHGMLAPWFRENQGRRHLLKRLSWTVCEGPLLRRAHSVLFTSELEADLARGAFPADNYRPDVVGYGIEGPPHCIVGPTENTDAFVACDRGHQLLFLGRLHPIKGCEMLVEAFSRVESEFPRAELILAGPDGGCLAEIQRTVQGLSCGSRIKWIGELTRESKWEHLRRAQALVLPSHQENFSLVVAEALSCGTPVLLTDKVNTWPDVISGQAGLVSTDTPEGVEIMLRNFLSLSLEKQVAMSVQAREVYRAKFSSRNAALRLVAVMEKRVRSSCSRITGRQYDTWSS